MAYRGRVLIDAELIMGVTPKVTQNVIANQLVLKNLVSGAMSVFATHHYQQPTTNIVQIPGVDTMESVILHMCMHFVG